METFLYFIKGLLIFTLWLAYLLMCVVTMWITRYKKAWQRFLVGVISFLITPTLFLAIWLPVQYFYDKRKGNLD